MKVRIETDGTPARTAIFDADTGEQLCDVHRIVLDMRRDLDGESVTCRLERRDGMTTEATVSAILPLSGDA